MAKHNVLYGMSAVVLMAGGLFYPSGASAAPLVVENCDTLENCAVVTDTATLQAAIEAEKTNIVVGSNFDLTADIRNTVNTTIYLNNYTITSNGWSFVNNHDLTIYAGENGMIEEVGGEWAPFYAYSKLVLNGGTIRTAGLSIYASDKDENGDTEVVIDGATINAMSEENVEAIYANSANVNLKSGTINYHGIASGVSLDDGSSMVMDDGEIKADGDDAYGVVTWNGSSFTMNGGTITSKSVALGGNGTTDPSKPNYGENTVWRLNAGTLNSDDLGVYQPQKGADTIIGKDVTINGYNSGIEVRSGSLTINGATITVTGENVGYNTEPNGSGSTTNGAAVAVAQHTTTLPITVTINDGTFTGPVALSEKNPQNNGEEDIEKVTMSVTGGTFVATNGQPIVVSEDVEKFVSGGQFSKQIDGAYVANNYDEYRVGDWYIVDAAPVAYQGDDLFMQKEATETLDLGEVGNKYATLSATGESITISGRTVTAAAKGNGTVTINYNTLVNPMSTTIGAVVYAVEPDNDIDVVDNTEDRVAIADFATEQVGALIESDEESNNYMELYPQFNQEGDEIVKSGLDRLKDALIAGDSLTTYVDAMDLAEDRWEDNDGYQAILEHLEDGEEIAMLYDVTVGLYANGNNLMGVLTDLGENEIEFELEIPEEYREAPAGYTREFSVLRFHRGPVTRLDAEREGDVLKVSSSVFSAYAVTYTDTATGTTPDTGVATNGDTNSASTKNLAIAIMVGVIVAFVSFKRLRTRK